MLWKPLAALAAALVLSLSLAPGLRAADEEDEDEPKGPLAATIKACEKKIDANDIAGARKDIEAALAKTPEDKEGRSLLARIKFFYADDEGARAELAKGSGDATDVMLGKVLDGPFAAKLGEDASKFQGKTKGGHYFLATDLDSGNPAVKKVAKGKMAPGFEATALLLEQMYGAYSNAFKDERDRKLVSRVFVFASRDDYVAWSKEALDEEMDDAAAYYDPFHRLLVVDADAPDRLSDYGRDSMFHEGFHQFLHYVLPSETTPYWFNEGIAEWFGPSRVTPGGRGLEVGLLPRRSEDDEGTLGRAQKTLSRWTPLRDLLLFDAERFMDGERALMHYSQSWAVVHFLSSTDGGKKQILAYYGLLRDGKSQAECFEKVFAKGIDKLETDVKAYVRKLPAP